MTLIICDIVWCDYTISIELESSLRARGWKWEWNCLCSTEVQKGHCCSPPSETFSIYRKWALAFWLIATLRDGYGCTMQGLSTQYTIDAHKSFFFFFSDGSLMPLLLFNGAWLILAGVPIMLQQQAVYMAVAVCTWLLMITASAFWYQLFHSNKRSNWGYHSYYRVIFTRSWNKLPVIVKALSFCKC